jgi:hypothetical protein
VPQRGINLTALRRGSTPFVGRKQFCARVWVVELPRFVALLLDALRDFH